MSEEFKCICRPVPQPPPPSELVAHRLIFLFWFGAFFFTCALTSGLCWQLAIFVRHVASITLRTLAAN
jgi:hypothetical protein